MTFAEEIEERCGGADKIEAIVIGELEWGDEERAVPTEHKHIMLSWGVARPHLDYEYDRGFGGVECHAIYAWTASSVYFVTQYDGATYIDAAPRSPCDCTPDMPGS